MPNESTTTEDLELFTLHGFLGKIILWLIPAFFFWFITAAIICFPAIFIANLILPYLMPSIVSGLEQQRYLVDVITELTVKNAMGEEGILVFEINALKYAYGFPLFYALTMATTTSIYAKLDTLTYGFIVIIFAQTWSICFEVISSLLLKMGGENFDQITQALPFYSDSWVLTGVALAYQLGFLILPAIIPIAYWVLRHQSFFEQISSQRRILAPP